MGDRWQYGAARTKGSLFESIKGTLMVESTNLAI